MSFKAETRVKQFDRLLEFANRPMLDRLGKALFPEKNSPYLRSVAGLKRALRERIVADGLVGAALSELVVAPENEFIPSGDWVLDELVGQSTDVLLHPHFTTARRVVRRRYRPGSGKRVCVLLPCHQVKPYRYSPTIEAVESLLAQSGLLAATSLVIVSVPGFVPLEFDRYYPFAYYDWDRRRESKAALDLYVSETRRRAIDFFECTRDFFERYCLYFRPAAVQVPAIVDAARVQGVRLATAPEARTVRSLQSRSRALWRFWGLKSPQCLQDLRKKVDHSPGAVSHVTHHR